MSAAKRLMIKYDLPQAPSQAEIEQFYKMTKTLFALKRGDHEDVARSVAKDTFTGYGTAFRESQADSIEMLLKQIEQGT